MDLCLQPSLGAALQEPHTSLLQGYWSEAVFEATSTLDAVLLGPGKLECRIMICG